MIRNMVVNKYMYVVYTTNCVLTVMIRRDWWHTHTRLTALLSGTTQVRRYQKGKTNLDFTEARDSEWQWQQLGHMQVCTLLQTITPATHHSVFFTDWMPFLPPNQQRQSNEETGGKLIVITKNSNARPQRALGS